MTRRWYRRAAAAMAMGLAAASVVSGCSTIDGQQSMDGRFASKALTEAFVQAVASNGLVSMRGDSRGRTGDVMATSLLYRAGAAGMTAPTVAQIEEVCTASGMGIPRLQFSQELSVVVPQTTFREALGKVACVSIDPPKLAGGSQQDALQFIADSARWVSLPGITMDSLRISELKSALQQIGSDATSPWVRWSCEVAAEKVGDTELCSELPETAAVDQVNGTEQLMEFRAIMELHERGKYPNVDSKLLDRVLAIPLEDALDAAQVQAVSRISGRQSQPLVNWLGKQQGLVGKSGFVETEVEVLGTIQETYAAARVLDTDTRRIVNETTRKSLNEVVSLAGQSSRTDGVAAQTMRAAILDAAGLLPAEEKNAALQAYSSLQTGDCTAAVFSSCLVAGDAAFILDPDGASPKNIEIPNDIPSGAAGDSIFYQVLARNWVVENLDDWIGAANKRKLDPLKDLANDELTPSQRMWAGAARSTLKPKLGTEAEEAAKKGLENLVGCRSVDLLAVSDMGTESCSSESTFAYYLTGVWVGN